MKKRIVYLIALIVVSCGLIVSAVMAQSPAPAGSPPSEEKKTMWHTITQGGWVMIPIAFCSIATLYLIGDGVLRTGPNRVAPPTHEENIKALFRQGDYVGAYNYCKENPSPLTNVLRVGAGLLGS